MEQKPLAFDTKVINRNALHTNKRQISFYKVNFKTIILPSKVCIIKKVHRNLLLDI